MQEHVYIVHHVSGRVRLKIPQARGNESLCDQIKKMGESLPGIQAVSVNSLTGSVLVHYDENNPNVREHLLGALDNLDNYIALMLPKVFNSQA